MTGLHHDPIDHTEEQLVQVVLLQQMVELAQGCFIRNRLRHKIDPGKFPHSIAIVYRIFCCRVR